MVSEHVRLVLVSKQIWLKSYVEIWGFCVLMVGMSKWWCVDVEYVFNLMKMHEIHMEHVMTECMYACDGMNYGKYVTWMMCWWWICIQFDENAWTSHVTCHDRILYVCVCMCFICIWMMDDMITWCAWLIWCYMHVCIYVMPCSNLCKHV